MHMDQQSQIRFTRSREVEALFANYRSGAAFLEHDTVYAIPSIVVPDLSSSNLFTREQLKVEKAFAVQCELQSSLGFRHGHAVRYGLLTADSSNILLGQAESPNLTRADILGLTALGRPLDSKRERLLGVAGRLITLPRFLAATLELRKEFEALPEDVRPPWPLQRSFRIPGHDRSNSDGKLSPIPDALGAHAGRNGMFEGCEWEETSSEDDPAETSTGAAFQRRLGNHLDTWGLSSLVDWHLPDPDAPLVPNPLAPGSPAEPRHGIHILLPLHYPLRGDDEDFMRRVKEAQRDRAEELGLPPEVAGIDNYKEFAQILRLCHVQQVLCSRWPAKPPRGAVGLIEKAAARVLGITASSTRRLRTLSENLRSGKSSSIPRRRL